MTWKNEASLSQAAIPDKSRAQHFSGVGVRVMYMHACSCILYIVWPIFWKNSRLWGQAAHRGAKCLDSIRGIMVLGSGVMLRTKV